MRLGPIIGKKNKDKKVPSSPQTMLFDSVIGDRLSFKYQVIIKRERKGWSNKVWYQYFGPPLSSFLWLVTLRFNGSELPVPLTFSRFARSFSCEGRPPRAYFEKVTQCNKRISHWRPTFFLPLSNSFALNEIDPLLLEGWLLVIVPLDREKGGAWIGLGHADNDTGCIPRRGLTNQGREIGLCNLYAIGMEISLMGTCGVKKRISCAIGLTLISDLLDTWIDLDFLFIYSIVCCLDFCQ
jgi:hypothetical protein